MKASEAFAAWFDGEEVQVAIKGTWRDVRWFAVTSDQGAPCNPRVFYACPRGAGFDTAEIEARWLSYRLSPGRASPDWCE